MIKFYVGERSNKLDIYSKFIIRCVVNNIKRRKKIKSFIELNLGILLVAISTVFFMNPNNIAAGGFTGVVILLQEFTGIAYYYFLYMINAVLLILAFIVLGKKVFVNVAYGTVMYTITVSILNYIMTFYEYPDFEGQMFLVVIYAALSMGIGCGLSYRNRGTTGGGDILQAIFLKLFNIPYSKTMYMLEIPVIVVGMCTFGLVKGLIAILVVILIGYVVDTVTFGGYDKRSVYIISSHHEEITDYINNTIVRGVTYLDAQGAYQKENKKVILTLLNTKEYFQLRAYVENIDHESFMFANRATEVRGYGFSLETPIRDKISKHKKN